MRESRFTRVQYLRINRGCLEIVCTLGEHEKAVFLDQCLAWFLQLEQGEEIKMVDTGNATLNLAMREEMAELDEGFIQYMHRATNTKKGKDTNGTPQVHQRDTNGTPQAHLTEQTKPKENYIQNIEQTKSDLVRYGCTTDEISMAVASVKDWTDIQNPTAYLLQIIKNQRQKSRKVLPAQNFPQRDYSDVNKQVMDDLAREMADFKAEEGA